MAQYPEIPLSGQAYQPQPTMTPTAPIVPQQPMVPQQPAGFTKEKALDIFRKFILPGASVLETIATSIASKGHNVGTSAIQGMKGLDAMQGREQEQRMAEEKARGEAVSRGIQDDIGRAKLSQMTGEQKEPGLEHPTGLGEEEKLKYIKDFYFRTGKFGEYSKLAKNGEPEKPSLELARFENTLSTSVRNDPSVKDFGVIDRQMDKLDAVWEDYVKTPMNPETGRKRSLVAIDQAIIMIFNKLLDPGSVVRESEFARTPRAAALAEQVKGWIPKLQQGGVGLTDSDRLAIVKASRLIKAAAEDGYANVLKDKFGLMQQQAEFGVNPKRIFTPEQLRLISMESPFKINESGVPTEAKSISPTEAEPQTSEMKELIGLARGTSEEAKKAREALNGMGVTY